MKDLNQISRLLFFSGRPTDKVSLSSEAYYSSSIILRFLPMRGFFGTSFSESVRISSEFVGLLDTPPMSDFEDSSSRALFARYSLTISSAFSCLATSLSIISDYSLSFVSEFLYPMHILTNARTSPSNHFLHVWKSLSRLDSGRLM